MTIGKMLFSAKGRIRRRDYWLYSIAIGMASMVIMLVAHELLGRGRFLEDLASVWLSPFEPFHILVIALNLLTLWPQYCLIAKRWHDRNRPDILALLMILYYSIPQAVVSKYVPLSPTSTLVIVGSILQLILSLVIIIDLGFLDGTQGPNKYGPSPKGLGKETIVSAFD